MQSTFSFFHNSATKKVIKVSSVRTFNFNDFAYEIKPLLNHKGD